MKLFKEFSSFKDITKSMGLVFGDIGTSPIYTLTIIFALLNPSKQNLMGVLSLVFWTLIILVSLQYAWLAMSLSTKGEGGIIVLKEILTGLLRKGRRYTFAAFLGYIGVSLLMGDGVITPAISILSAVEGLQLIPGLGNIDLKLLIIVTCVITIILFSIQFKGTDKVSYLFGPIMILWFISLFIFGMIQIMNYPGVVMSLNPMYAINFMLHNGITGLFVLSEVILCATGGEALYADMGHLGRDPIRHAWYFVFVALVVNYLGQGAYLINNKSDGSVLFEMVRSISPFLYIPFLITALFATIIASQAMISAVMSLVYQGITTRIFPLMKVKYTSTHMKSQIYIGIVNWVLMFAVIFMIIFFEKSENLAAAYGFAVTATMTISAMFMIAIFFMRKNYFQLSVAILVFIVCTLFLISVMNKIPHGGYWSIVVAAIPFFVIRLWYKGNERMRSSFRPLPMEIFLESYLQIYKDSRLKGTALFFVRNLTEVPPYMVHCIIRGNIIYEKNIMVSINTTDSPYGIGYTEINNIADGLSGIRIDIGYMEYLDIPKILKLNNISEKVIFYGVEDITTTNFMLKLFAFLKKVTPHFVRFYKLPYNKLHGVLTRLEM